MAETPNSTPFNAPGAAAATDTAPAPSGPWRLADVPCDFCGEADADVLLTGRDRAFGLPGEFAVVRCRACGLVRTNPQPTQESLATAYPEAYSPYQDGTRSPRPPEGALRWALVNILGYPLGEPAGPVVQALRGPWARWRLTRRRNVGYLPYAGEGRLLDVGCGAGRYLARMAAAGWTAEGLDASPTAVRVCREAGLVCHQGTLPGANLEAASFDAVTLWAALEHVPSPLATLRAARDLLRPGGRVLASVPNIESLAARHFGDAWYGLDLPRHLTHFSPATLARHFEKAGLEVERIHPRARPTFTRHSYAWLADETGKRRHRRLARSRLWVGLIATAGRLLGRAYDLVVIARRP